MVDVEFNIEASEDTIAAANAAKATPFNPTGKNCNNQGYALSACSTDGKFLSQASPNLAIISGSFIIT